MKHLIPLMVIVTSVAGCATGMNGSQQAGPAHEPHGVYADPTYPGPGARIGVGIGSWGGRSGAGVGIGMGF